MNFEQKEQGSALNAAEPRHHVHQQSTWNILQNEIQSKLQTSLEDISKNDTPESLLVKEDSRNLFVENLSKDLVSLVQARVPSPSSCYPLTNNTAATAPRPATTHYGSTTTGSASEQIVAAAAAVAASSSGSVDLKDPTSGTGSNDHCPHRSISRFSSGILKTALGPKTANDVLKDAELVSNPPPNREHIWTLRLDELKEFKSINGHCLVPKVYPPNPALGRWVGRQRCSYKLKIEGKANRLSDERFYELDELGFAWDGSPSVKRNVKYHLDMITNATAGKAERQTTTSTDRFRFKKKRKTPKTATIKKENTSSINPHSTNAHATYPVPTLSPDFKAKKETPSRSESFEKFSPAQKKNKRSKPHTKRGIEESASEAATDDKDNNDDHSSDNKKQRTTRDAQWDIRFNELLDYKAKHGHCKVPRTVPILGRWVKKQREQLKLKKEGTINNCLNDDRYRRLCDIGFVWDFPRPDDWETRFQQLEQYVKEHGNAMVPKNYDANPSLGRWVGRQRTNFRQLKEGKPSSLTKEKIQRLSSIGFIWCASGSSNTSNKHTDLVDTFDSSTETNNNRQEKHNASSSAVRSPSNTTASAASQSSFENYMSTETFDAATAAAIAAAASVAADNNKSDFPAPTRVAML